MLGEALRHDSNNGYKEANLSCLIVQMIMMLSWQHDRINKLGFLIIL